MYKTARGEHLDILYRWVRYSSRFDLSDILKKHGIHKIAIYGGGVLGVALYENLATSIDIKYIIDRNTELSFPYNKIQTIHPEQTDFLYDLDAVIITVDYYNVEKLLNPYVKCLLLDHLIINIDEYYLFEKAIQHIEASGAFLWLGDVTMPLYYIKNPSFFEKIAKSDKLTWHDNYKSDVMLTYFNDLAECSYAYCDKIYNAPYSVIHKNGVPYVRDIYTEYVNIINHCRLTTDAPDNYDNTIYIFGHCYVWGHGAEDRYTIQSNLQRMLNNLKIKIPTNKTFRVVGVAGIAGKALTDNFLQILNTTFKAGDYIILIRRHLLDFEFYCGGSSTTKYLNLANAFDRPHEYSGEIFLDGYHINHRGYNLLAKRLYSEFEKLLEGGEEEATVNNISREISPKDRGSSVSCLSLKNDKSDIERNGLDEYLNLLQHEKVDINGIIGSIVMNCNPFTLGHRYLIEEAKKNCDFLYIFIVEEDKSFFSFSDRFKYAKEGITDIENVKILPSGRFIISTLTFPEYFIKETAKTTIDASLDIKLFAEQIAPVLNIKKRFAGKEPFCPITRQYNRVMEEILPLHGIEFILFERKEVNTVPISASIVRKLISDNNFDELRMFVPESTYKYLCEVH